MNALQLNVVLKLPIECVNSNEKRMKEDLKQSLRRVVVSKNTVKYGARHIRFFNAQAALEGGTELHFIRIHR